MNELTLTFCEDFPNASKFTFFGFLGCQTPSQEDLTSFNEDGLVFYGEKPRKIESGAKKFQWRREKDFQTSKEE